MTAHILSLVASVLLLVGALFCLLAAIGLLRFPDLYTRIHAASKAGALGACVLLLALALASGEPGVVTRAIAGIVFFLLTAPVAAHLVARAAYMSGLAPDQVTGIDRLGEAMQMPKGQGVHDLHPGHPRPDAQREAEPAGNVPDAQRETGPAGNMPDAQREAEPAGNMPDAQREARPAGNMPDAQREAEPAGNMPDAQREARPAGNMPDAQREAGPGKT